jgi:hypothetical protein
MSVRYISLKNVLFIATISHIAHYNFRVDEKYREVQIFDYY